MQDEKFFHLHGQGLLWGVELLGGHDLKRLKQLCEKEAVWPYFVEGPIAGVTGFMISPALDISNEHFREGLHRIQRALQALKAELA